MLLSKQIELRQSTIRQSLSELAGKDTPTEDETRSMDSLDKEYRSNETRLRAAIISEDAERREAAGELENRSDREYADLVGKFELRQVALALDEGKALDGATAELVQEMRNAGGYQGIPVPYAALMETRAGESIASGQVNPKQIRPVIDRLFPNSVAARLGVQSIQIAQGEVSFPVATAGAVFGWQTTELGDVGAANPYATSERSLNPDHTGGAQMVISRKALKQAGTGLEAAIRRDLNAVIATEIDRVVVNGTGATGQPLGFIPGASTYGISVEEVANFESWNIFKAEIVAFMQANAIASPSEVTVAFGPQIWSDLDGSIVEGLMMTDLDRLQRHVGAPAISNVIPAETAIMTANVQGVAPGYLGLYGGVDLIRDPYTKAASGQLVLTGLVTADFTVPRGLQTRILQTEA